MPDDTPRYFQLKTEFHGQKLGVDDAGNLYPLVEEGINIVAPVRIQAMVDGKPFDEVIDETRRSVIVPAEQIPAESVIVDVLRARIIPDTRIVESIDWRVDGALLAYGKYEQIDPPTKKQLTEAVKATQDSRERAGLFNDDGTLKEARPDAQVAAGGVPDAGATDNDNNGGE